jgi:hypothetical protein
LVEVDQSVVVIRFLDLLLEVVGHAKKGLFFKLAFGEGLEYGHIVLFSIFVNRSECPDVKVEWMLSVVNAKSLVN